MSTKTNPRWNSLFCLLILASLFLSSAIEASANSYRTPGQAIIQAALTKSQATSNQADPDALNATTQDLLGAVSGEQIAGQVGKLEKFSRCLLDPGHQQAGDYIINSLRDMGFSPIVQNFQASTARGVPLRNIIVRRPGTNPKAVHMAVAHWDSSPSRTFPPACNSLAPGANDNASGIAALLEMARLLGNGQDSRYAFQDDVELVWFDAEEFGLLGSQYFNEKWNTDRQVNPRGLPLGAVVNLDMVGYKGEKAQGEVWAVTQDPGSQGLGKTGAELVKSYLPGVKYGIYTIGDKFPAARDPNRNSDQLSFWNANQGQAIFLTGDIANNLGGDSRWHTPGDLLYLDDGSLRLDPALLADSTRVALLIVGSQAGIGPGRFFNRLAVPFEQNWSKADRPVRIATETGQAPGRGWLWGPQPNRETREAYAEAPGGQREVIYFDKARMELSNPSSGYVTNGLLVTEMTTGQRQLGDNRFEFRGPSTLQVAGDSNELNRNQNAPTYASFTALVNAGPVKDATGQRVQAIINRAGQASQNPALSGLAVNRYFAADTGHNIPDVFWNWFAQEGKFYDAQSDVYRSGQVFDWLSAVGLPMTEAYWVRTQVGGVEKDVLVQLFQRRVLTFTPDNPAGWQVEMGNVGQHYVAWRYEN
jgi:hypothetical protein